MRQALRFAGRRNLLEEYGETLLEIAQLRPTGGLVEWLVQAMLADVKALGLESLAAMLRAQQ